MPNASIDRGKRNEAKDLKDRRGITSEGKKDRRRRCLFCSKCADNTERLKHYPRRDTAKKQMVIDIWMICPTGREIDAERQADPRKALEYSGHRRSAKRRKVR